MNRYIDAHLLKDTYSHHGAHQAVYSAWWSAVTLDAAYRISSPHSVSHITQAGFFSTPVGRNPCCRSQVLRKLGMIDEEGIVTLKGRAACEIDTADELLTTEMMFNGTFNGLDKHQLVALVSCLVPGEKSQVC